MKTNFGLPQTYFLITVAIIQSARETQGGDLQLITWSVRGQQPGSGQVPDLGKDFDLGFILGKQHVVFQARQALVKVELVGAIIAGC